MNHNAIYALYPQVVTVDDGAGAFDAQGNKVDIDEALVVAWVDPMEYARKRSVEYPSISDVIVALAEKEEGRTEMWDEITAKRQEIRNKYPK